MVSEPNYLMLLTILFDVDIQFNFDVLYCEYFVLFFNYGKLTCYRINLLNKFFFHLKR